MLGANAASVTETETESSGNAWKGNAAAMVITSAANMCGMNAVNITVTVKGNSTSALKEEVAEDKEEAVPKSNPILDTGNFLPVFFCGLLATCPRTRRRNSLRWREENNEGRENAGLVRSPPQTHIHC